MDTIVSFDALEYDSVKVQTRLEANPGLGFKLDAALYLSQRLQLVLSTPVSKSNEKDNDIGKIAGKINMTHSGYWTH